MNGGKWTTKALAHLEMARPYTMFHSGLVAIAGIEVASGGHVAAWRTALAALVTMCGWEAGLYAGDYYDRELDARSKPTRPGRTVHSKLAPLRATRGLVRWGGRRRQTTRRSRTRCLSC